MVPVSVLLTGRLVRMRLETARLLLRSAETSDAEFLLRLFTTADVLRYLPVGPPWTIDTARKSIESRRRLEASRGFAPLIAVLKDTEERIGSAGLRPIPDTTEVEIQFHYLPSAWNKGVGTEAAISLLSDGLFSKGLDRIIGLAFPANVGSSRVMEKAGMSFVGPAGYFGIENLRKYVAVRETWRSGVTTNSRSGPN